MARERDPGVVLVRPFALDDLEKAADFCDRARALDPSIEPFSQRLALIATGPRALLPLWQVAEGEDGLLHGIAFAAVREQRESASAALAKSTPQEVLAEKMNAPTGALSRPPRQPYAAAPKLGAFAGARVGKPPPQPLAPERLAPRTLQPARPRQPAPNKAGAESLASQSLGSQASSRELGGAPRPPPLEPAKPQRTTLEIYAAVHPPLRRQGLGRALLEPMLEWVRRAREPVALRARVSDAPEARAGLGLLGALGFAQSRAVLSLAWSQAQAPVVARELPALTLRKLGAQDATGLAQLARLSDAAWVGAPDAFQTRADELAQLISELGRLVILATAEGRGVGYLSGVWLGKTLGIEEVAVLPEYRRAGVGRALVSAALQRDARAALLSVSEENRAARALYRSLGFVQTARKLIYTLEGGP